MTLILYFIQSGQTPLYIACSNGHDKVVQALLDHGVQVDIPDKVSDISVTYHVKLCHKTKIDEATLVTQEINKNDVHVLSCCSDMTSIIDINITYNLIMNYIHFCQFSINIYLEPSLILRFSESNRCQALG